MPLAHTRLLVINFPECYRFYRDILQLRPSWGDEADSYASFTQGGDGKIVLAIYGRQAMSEVVGTAHLPLDPPAQDRSLLIFQVEDLDATVKRMEQQGVRFVLEPTDFPDWGMRGAYLRDPDGNLIELSGALPAANFTDGLREANEKWKARDR